MSGMSADEFWDSSIKEVIISINGYKKRENESWQRTRLQSYIIYCSVTEQGKRVPIYEFLELEDDPTPEEIAESQQRKAKKEELEMMAAYEQAKAAGII